MKSPFPRRPDRRRLTQVAIVFACAVLAVSGLVRGADPAPPAAVPTFQKYCFQCHGSEPGMGGVSLKTLTSGPMTDAGFPKWQRVVKSVMHGTGLWP